MTAKTLKFRVRRQLRRSQRQMEDFSQQADQHIDQHFVRRLTRLINVRRFVSVWIVLILLLIGCLIAQTNELSAYYQLLHPVPGGIYTEGILGDFTTANPLYATGPVDSSVSRLVFAGLLKYGSDNKLVGDLASSWKVDSTGKIYTVHLKPGLTWQDGSPLTAKDVAFTYHTIQNPVTQSPLNASWQNITVKAIGQLTVTFTLANPLAAFPYSLTNGIVPQHLLANIPASNLRSASFNTDPVGSGPFSWQSLAVQGSTPQTRQEQIDLTPFASYNGGEPKLDQFIVRGFHDKNQLIQSFKSGQLNAAVGLNDVPASLSGTKNVWQYSLPLMAANMVFFKTTAGVMSDTAVRRALVQGADVNKIITGLGYPVLPVREPLLSGQIGYNPTYEQKTGDPRGAAATLQQDGWQPGKNGILAKAGQQLKFTLYAPDTHDARYIARSLQVQWHAIGADVQLIFQGTVDLQSTLTYHTYDALLYGISIGADPDVFAFWDSSQASPASLTHSNFSEYQSSAADTGLEAGRTISDPAERIVKYQQFLQAWQSDAPALGLYQPRILYLTRQPVYGLDEYPINQATDRFDNVQNWEIRQGKVND